jgi:hypothetical protein
MATSALQLPRFQLPARIRAHKTGSEVLPARQALLDRVAKLPGIETTECTDDTLRLQIVIYLHGATARRTIRNPRPFMLCNLSDDGIAIYGLDNWAKHQVVMRGWGKLINDRVQLFLPRDDDELEICWSILRLAYDLLFDAPASRPATGNRSSWDMPQFSRTTLQ